MNAYPIIGIMQGRLLPPYHGRFQAFPAETWREEFPLAVQAGLGCIEFIYEKPGEELNPFFTDDGLNELRAIIARTGVAVRSICADYYMTERLVDDAGRPVAENVRHLQWLCAQAGKLGVTYMVLPFVDSSSLKTAEQVACAAAILRDVAPVAGANGVELHIECDLPPTAFRALLDQIGKTNVKANFDIGNSASLGYDPTEELTLLAPYLGSVHIKDRERGGGTRPLGTANADLPTAFRMIRRSGFSRWFILQAARGEDGGEVALAASNRVLAERLWAEAG